MSLIKAQNLTKKYQSKKVHNLVINDLNLEIEDGEFVIITGPSGSGKTTLLYLLSGLQRPTKGNVYFNNKELNLFSKKEFLDFRQNETAIIFQYFNLISTLNVFDNISLPLIISNKEVDSSRILELLEKVDLKEASKLFPDELSGGMQQRVAICRALVNNPKVIFADEPTGSLDEKNAEEVMNILSLINKEYGTTIVLVTHNHRLFPYGTRVIELSNAQIIRDEQI